MFTGLRRAVMVAAVSVLIGAPAWADVPWDVFDDDHPGSSSRCDVVNTANHELVVWSDTGELIIVDGVDTFIDGTFVDGIGDVYYYGDYVGYLAFDEDGDGYRTLWWLSDAGFVVGVDAFSGEPYETAWIPYDFTHVACDACDYWDDAADCTEIIIVDPNPGTTPVTVNFCGAAGTPALAMTVCGLIGLHFARRRW